MAPFTAASCFCSLPIRVTNLRRHSSPSARGSRLGLGPCSYSTTHACAGKVHEMPTVGCLGFWRWMSVNLRPCG
jgi:hypothetical protein